MGLLLALALRTTNRIGSLKLPTNRMGVPASVLSGYVEQNERLQRELAELRRQLHDFETNQQSESRSSRLLREQLREYKAMAGFLPVRGPGLKVRLQHSTAQRLPGTHDYLYWVADKDINGLVSELWAAGAEAISVSEENGRKAQRVIATTTIHAEGKTVLINGQRLTAPYEIRAIGNPKELRAALEMPDGFIQTHNLDILKMITLEEASNLVLPAYPRSGGPGAAPEPHQ